MAFQACLETHCIGELGDADDDNGDIADMIIPFLMASSCVLVMLVTERYVSGI